MIRHQQTISITGKQVGIIDNRNLTMSISGLSRECGSLIDVQLGLGEDPSSCKHFRSTRWAVKGTKCFSMEEIGGLMCSRFQIFHKCELVIVSMGILV